MYNDTEITESRRRFLYIGLTENTQDQTVSLTRPLLQNWWGPSPMEIGNNGSVLLRLFPSSANDQDDEIKYAIVDSAGNPIWASETVEFYGPQRSFSFPEYPCETATLSPDGMRVIYFKTEDASVHIVTLEQNE